MNFPDGNVTFFFADVENSARLWSQYPDAMLAATTGYDALAAALIAQHAGRVVKSRGEGDSLFAVFARAADAVAAACALQCAMLTADWPEETPLRLRIALHAGEAHLRDNDYFGAAVNRCARLRAIASGGQTLLSEAAAESAQEALPANARLKDLGRHRLQDLQRPERIFQLLHPDLPADFPPLRSLEAVPNNLPQQLNAFIGREREIAEAKRLLETARLLTITGAGGTGKTRLALHIGADVLNAYPDGVWLVELASLSDPALVPGAVAAALGVREERDRPALQATLEFLAPKTLLLLLDNCEHLKTACAEWAEAALSACPGARILASSRERLGVGGEAVLRLAALSLPDPRHLPALEDLQQYEAVRLFAERAGAVQMAFSVNSRNAPSVAQVCHRLDGIPLAIELAAARIKALSVEQIAERLDDRFRLLTGGSRTALPRQQTLRSLIDWSYDLLSPAEKALFHRLSVFAGGWTLEAAEAIFDFRLATPDGEASAEAIANRAESPETIENRQSPIENRDVLDLLTSLVEKSLVIPDPAQERYTLLETMRQYAGEKARARGEWEPLRTRHMERFLQFAEQAEQKLRGSPDQAAWMGRLDSDYDNLRAAMEWSLRDEADPENALRLAGALYRFWMLRGRMETGREFLNAALARPGADRPTLGRAKALLAAGRLASEYGEPRIARDSMEQSYRIFEQLQLPGGMAYTLCALGHQHLHRGEYERAGELLRRSLEIAQQRGNRRDQAWPLGGLGLVALEQGDFAGASPWFARSEAVYAEMGDRPNQAIMLGLHGYALWCQGKAGEARNYLERGLEIQRAMEDRRGIGWTLFHLGSVARVQRDYVTARALYAESLRLRRELQQKAGIPWALFGLAVIMAEEGDLGAAGSCYKDCLMDFQDLKDTTGIAAALERIAALAAKQGATERAVRLFAAAEAYREQVGTPLPQVIREEYYACAVQEAASALGRERFEFAWQEGRALALEQAIGYALS